MPRTPKGSVADSNKEKLDLESTNQHSEEVEDEDDSDEDDILETSENGRWQKFNEQVARDVPGIDAAYLAMDTDDGVEVVWNEVCYSNRKVVKGNKETLVKILKRLTEVKHDNIVNFIDFWHDKADNQDRLVFITEYMTSGSLLQFLKKASATKKTVSEKIWRRWCRQILAALSYLHKNDVVHGNLSLATIFIQHNGLVKIGSVSPDAIHEHVKTKTDMTMRMQYTAPEYAFEEGPIRTAADIYSFGICALEMLNLDLLGNSDIRPTTLVNSEAVHKAVEGLESEHHRAFIKLCLQENPGVRPKASALLKHRVLQEVFNLKVLSARQLVDKKVSREQMEAELGARYPDKDATLAQVYYKSREPKNWKVGEVPHLDLDKLLEEISLDVFYMYHNESRPLSTHSPQKKDDSNSRTVLPSSTSANERNSQMYEKETRMVQTVNCEVKLEGEKRELTLRITFDDKMQRELASELKNDDSASSLAFDLVCNGLVSEHNQDKIEKLIEEKLKPLLLTQSVHLAGE